MSLTLLKPFNLDTTLNYTFGNVTGSDTTFTSANITGGANATTTTTGALKVAGGAGITGNVFIGGTLTASSNLTINGAASVTGNVTLSGTSNLGPISNVKITGGTSGQVIITDGTGNISFSNPTAVTLANGTSNISIPVTSANINFSSAGNANVLIITGTGINVAGYINSSGNANVGNLGTAGLISATGNITGGNLHGTKVTVSQLVSNVTTGSAPLIVTSTTQVANLFATKAVTVSDAAQPNITSVGTLTGLSVSGSISSSGDTSATNLIATADVSGSTLTGPLTTAAQPNITSVGILSNLRVSGTVSFTGANVSLGNIANLYIPGGTTDQVLKTDGAGNLSWGTVTGGTGGGNGATTLATLTDVSITGVTDGQALVYDLANTKWVNGTVSGGGGGSLTITDNTTTDATYYPVYATASTGSMSIAGISTTKMQFNPSSGQLTVQDLNTLSDATLKENAAQIDDPFEVLSQIFGMGFNWKDTGKKSYGVMAQMLEKVLPELVSVNAQGKKTVNYIPIIAFLVEAVNRQQQDIKSLKQR